jgi:hypothetical protein
VVLPDLVLELLKSCESDCVAECCGLDAFDFSTERFRPWLQDRPAEDREAVGVKLEGLLRELQGRPEELAASSERNAAWAKAGAAAFFSELLQTLKGAR